MEAYSHFPRTLSDLLGHERQKEYFKKLLSNGNLSHAYCFSGLSGIGKLSMARAVARQLMCGESKESLIKFDSCNHPDYLEIFKDGNSIKTEQVEALHNFMHIKPYISEYKVVIIDDSHLMTEAAQNKMLKILEEPPGHALFVFVTDRPFKLLPTIRSRLVMITFQPLSTEDMLQVAQRLNMPVNNKLLLSSLGSMARYKKWSEDSFYPEFIDTLTRGLKALCLGKNAQWMSAFKCFDELKEESGEIFDFILVWFVDLSMVKAGLDSSYLRLSFEYESMVQYSESLTTDALNNARAVVLEAIQALDRQQNYALVVDSMFFNIQEAFHGKGNRRTL